MAQTGIGISLIHCLSHYVCFGYLVYLMDINYCVDDVLCVFCLSSSTG